MKMSYRVILQRGSCMLQVVVFYTKKKLLLLLHQIQQNTDKQYPQKRDILYLLNFFSITLSVRSGIIEDWNTLMGDVILVSQ